MNDKQYEQLRGKLHICGDWGIRGSLTKWEARALLKWFGTGQANLQRIMEREPAGKYVYFHRAEVSWGRMVKWIQEGE